MGRGSGGGSRNAKGGGGETADYQKMNDYLMESVKPALSSSEIKAIEAYTVSASDINDRIREGTPLTKAEKKQVAQMDEVLQKLPAWKGETYRNLDIREKDVPAFLQNYKPGETITFPAYSSSSVHTAGTIAGNIEMVITAKGKKGRTIFGLTKYNAKDEREVLFERNTSFRIKKVTPKIDYPFFYNKPMPAGTQKQVVGARIELEEV
jgi:hypothetical protein